MSTGFQGLNDILDGNDWMDEWLSDGLVVRRHTGQAGDGDSGGQSCRALQSFDESMLSRWLLYGMGW